MDKQKNILGYADSPKDLPLRIRSVTKRYGNRIVLDALSLDVQRGEIVSLLGPNGAGKSTTLALALGFTKADSGSVEVAGIDVTNNPQVSREHVGFIPENVQLYPALSGIENLQYFTALSGSKLKDDALKEALLAAGLQPSAHRRLLRDYSKGMRQKTGIALALLRRCELLLLDEPTSGLDPIASEEFHRLLRGIADRGTGILMATHDLGRVLDVSNRVLILRAGKMVAEFAQERFTEVDLQAAYIQAMQEEAVA